MSMELKLLTAEVSIPQAIENLEQLKAEIAPKMEHYRSLIVTEDSIKEAKKDKAALNKLREAISDQRIAVKKQCLAPYEQLERQCKELDALIVAPISAIDSQIKAFEEREKKAKYDELKEYFDSVNETDWITLEDVLNPKWANKSEKTDSLRAEISGSIKRISDEFQKLTQMYTNFPHLIAIQDKYRQTKDFSVTMVYAKNLEWTWQKEQEQKRREQESAQNEPVSPPEPESVTSQPAPPEPVSAESDEPEPMITGTFRVTGTRTQIIALRDFMKSQGIKFEIVKE